MNTFNTHYSAKASGHHAVSSFLTYKEARDRICIRLINYEHNMGTVSHIPYILKEDIAVVFCLFPVEQGDAGQDRCDQQTITEKDSAAPEDPGLLITSEDLKTWEIDLYVLYRNALLISREVHPAVFVPMSSLLDIPDETDDSMPMYILSCRDGRYGASAALYPEVLAGIADKLNDDLYLIPSSVHEMIVLRAEDVRDPCGLHDVIHEVNRTEVLPCDVLSDSLYYYQRKTDHFERAKVIY